MLRLGIRGHDMEPAPFEQLVANIATKGFCCTQLALSKAVTDFNVSLDAMTSGMAMYMRDVFLKNGVDVAVLGCYLNLATPDKKELAQTYKAYEAHIRFASLLGCGMVGTETGAVNREYAFEASNSTEESLSLFIKRLRPVVEYAEKMGVLVGIEPVCRHIMTTVKRTRVVLDAINSPNLRVIFDPVNIFTPDNCRYQNEIMDEAFDIIGSEIDVIHMKDFVNRNNELDTAMPFGEGEMDFKHLFSLVKAYKPCINMLIEDSTPENIMQTKKYIETIY